MADELTIEKLMELMPKAFLPDKAVGVNTVIQYNLSGKEAWRLDRHHQGWRVHHREGEDR